MKDNSKKGGEQTLLKFFKKAPSNTASQQSQQSSQSASQNVEQPKPTRDSNLKKDTLIPEKDIETQNESNQSNDPKKSSQNKYSHLQNLNQPRATQAKDVIESKPTESKQPDNTKPIESKTSKNQLKPPQPQTSEKQSQKSPQTSESKKVPAKEVQPQKPAASPARKQVLSDNKKVKARQKSPEKSEMELEDSQTEMITEEMDSNGQDNQSDDEFLAKFAFKKNTPISSHKRLILSDDEELALPSKKISTTPIAAAPSKKQDPPKKPQNMIDEDEDDFVGNTSTPHKKEKRLFKNQKQVQSSEDEFLFEDFGNSSKATNSDRKNQAKATSSISKSPAPNNHQTASAAPRAKKSKPISESEEDDDDLGNQSEEVEKKPAKGEPKKQWKGAYKKAETTSTTTNQTVQPGTSDFLAKARIVFTGEFSGISRESLVKIVLSNGGTSPGSVSSKTTMLVHGSVLEDGRPVEQGKKYQNAQKLKVQIKSQDQFSEYLKQILGKGLEEMIKMDKGSSGIFDKFKADPKKSLPIAQPDASTNAPIVKKGLTPVNIPKQMQQPAAPQPPQLQAAAAPIALQPQVLWTQKHQPVSVSDCVGNQKCFENLMEWLHSWHDVVIKGNKKQVKNNFFIRNAVAASGGPSYNSPNPNAKACLLSGPPGVGKTTAVRLIAKFMGYDIREWNASDERSKKSVNQVLGELKSNSILHLVRKSDPTKPITTGQTEAVAQTNNKFIILMDEVDGMSSGDRGGNQALIEAIKVTKVPIFCICNDRMHPKVRSLANHCYDIKFSKPAKQDIAKYMVKICEKEGFTQVEAPAIEDITQRLGCDIRQTLSFLEMHFKTSTQLQKSDLTKLSAGQKDVTVMMEGFDASLSLMQQFKFSQLTLRERIELFFIDYDIIPLLVHQNYLDTIPKPEKEPDDHEKLKQLTELTKATASIAESDLLSQQIRSNGQWSLLSNFGFLSSIYPCSKICGEKPIYPKFPEWLGKNSSQRKTTRELREFRISISTAITGSRFAVKFDYLPVLHNILIQTLKKETDTSIEYALKIMESYGITPQHLKEHLNDLQYPKRDYYAVVSTQVKTKLTREFNRRFQDDSTKGSKGTKQSSANASQQKKFEQKMPKYDKNLDDFVYSDEKESDKENEDESDDESKDKKQQQTAPKKQAKKPASKMTMAKSAAPKPAKRLQKRKQESEDEDNSLDSFIDHDDDSNGDSEGY